MRMDIVVKGQTVPVAYAFIWVVAGAALLFLLISAIGCGLALSHGRN